MLFLFEIFSSVGCGIWRLPLNRALDQVLNFLRFHSFLDKHLFNLNTLLRIHQLLHNVFLKFNIRLYHFLWYIKFLLISKNFFVPAIFADLRSHGIDDFSQFFDFLEFGRYDWILVQFKIQPLFIDIFT